jgi:hypothetical protein
MNPIFNSTVNPLQEHLTNQETIRKDNCFIGYFFAFCIGIILCYLLMKRNEPLETKEHET